MEEESALQDTQIQGKIEVPAETKESWWSLDDFHSGVSGAILSAYLKADGGCIDKMQWRVKAIIHFLPALGMHSGGGKVALGPCIMQIPYLCWLNSERGKKNYTVFYFAYVLIVAVVLIRHWRATLMPSTLRVYRKLLCVKYSKCAKCSSDAFPIWKAIIVACWALVGGLASQASRGFSLSVCVSFYKWLSLVCRISQTF